MRAGFNVKKVAVKNGPFKYTAFRLTGWQDGRRIRKQFPNRDEAEGARLELEIQAANGATAIRPVNTRLSPAQIAEAEAVFSRLGSRPLAEAVDWFLANYRAPTAEIGLEAAAAAFTEDRKGNVSAAVSDDYRKTLRLLMRTFPARSVHAIPTAEIEAMMRTRGQAKKSWNNLRTYLHAFFEFCAHDSRRWVALNPVKAIRQHVIARGLPQILNAEQVGNLFAHLETYSGPERCGFKPGYLVPYFALATFAGIRPSVSNGELRKLHELADKSRVIDEGIGVIRLTPELTKTNGLRQITIQPNLAAWLKRYPLGEFPLMVKNMADHVAAVRKTLDLGDDVLRHTFVSMHVAKFKSLGATALEAGNSEAIIRRHYLNLVSDADAAVFWAIKPSA